MKESDDVNELYQWINNRYEEHVSGELSEEDYLKDLEYYKGRLAKLEADSVKQTDIKEEPKKESISPNRVRSTSIAGLRKKLMEEMKD